MKMKDAKEIGNQFGQRNLARALMQVPFNRKLSDKMNRLDLMSSREKIRGDIDNNSVDALGYWLGGDV